MRRRKFSREFKLEAVRLVKDRGVAVAQAARDLDLHANVLRKQVRDHEADPGSDHHRCRAAFTTSLLCRAGRKAT